MSAPVNVPAAVPPEDAPAPAPVAHDGTATTPYTSSEPEIVEKYESEQPTASHALAEESLEWSSDEKGVSQLRHTGKEVNDLGWNEASREIPQPLVGGLRNQQLWTLIRRFDKHTFHVKSIKEPPLANLDMNIAENEEFSPDKLRAQMERFYVVVVAGLFSFWKHIVRLRSWREWQRTSSFLAVYTAAWLLDLLVPTLIGFVMVLILYPESREYCFPPAPAAIIDSKTGGVKKPAAGVLASEGSITGAPEKHEGEAVEQEAHSFVNSISTLVVSTAAGKDPQGDPHKDEIAPDPTEMTEHVSDARDHSKGHESSVEHDRTKVSVSRAVWDKAAPTLRMLSDFVDTWERFGNALSPTPPFPHDKPRFTLAGCLLPMLILSSLTTSYMLTKGMGFGVGFTFFGDPIITPTIAFINRTYPRWERYVELRHTILRGVPTNAQLAVTLLRIGEKNRAPIPPPPTSDVPPPVKPHSTAGEGLEHLEGATDQEIEDAVQPAPDMDIVEDEGKHKPKKSKRILNAIKGVTKGGAHTLLTADKAKAAAGAHHAKDRLGVVRSAPQPVTGPIHFAARYKGKKGHAYITETATTPALSWTSNIDDVDPAWTILISDIEEVQKIGGLGWKSKIIVGWAMERQIMDGLLVRTKTGKEFHLTAIVMRDELFNRLISIGTQMWELVYLKMKPEYKLKTGESSIVLQLQITWCGTRTLVDRRNRNGDGGAPYFVMTINLEPYEPEKAAKWLLCNTCGTQFSSDNRDTLTSCHICDDERQYVPPSGQSFITLEELQESHHNEFVDYKHDSRITFIQTTPKFGIGQRGILIKTPKGNVLWDCIALLDQDTIKKIEELGGLKAIVISHPHYYTTHVQWGRAFRCPVYLASEDKSWTTIESSHQVALTEIETDIEGTGVKAVKLGGHFPGSLVALYDGRLFHADTLVTTPAALGNWSPRERPRGATTFAYMWSIPNMIPLSADEVARMWGVLKRYDFRAAHGAFDGFDIEDDKIKARTLQSMQIQVEHMGYGDHALLAESV
ncbi:hypothetical protein HJFPF1_08091 [Paramyrothecium foliicola]|nr:hypothetical protein HJFPF1_08091 [Paramyrothecium foliicola]